MWFKVTCSLLAMMLIVSVIGWIAFAWMDSWTMHGKNIVVPNVRGLNYNEAANILEGEGLTIELSDSVYDNGSRPGTVLEQNPKARAKVKPGRVIYVSINAFSPSTVTLPQLTDISVRQAQSTLQALGIKDVQIVPVFSEYKDLVLAAKMGGKNLLPGARIAVNSRVVLEVGDGMPEFQDSIKVDSLNNGSADDVEILNLL